MGETIDIRALIQKGAPANGEEAKTIIRVALEKIPGGASDLERRLSAALTEILVGRQLQSATYAARASALAVLDEIRRRSLPALDCGPPLPSGAASAKGKP